MPTDPLLQGSGSIRRVLVCGSRTWTDRRVIRSRLSLLVPQDPQADEPTIVHGAARGADKIAANVAMWLGFWVEAHPANWKKHGKAAGPIRNRAMLDTGIDLVLAFQRGESRGTQDTIDEARRRGIPVEILREDWPTSHEPIPESDLERATAFVKERGWVK